MMFLSHEIPISQIESAGFSVCLFHGIQKQPIFKKMKIIDSSETINIIKGLWRCASVRPTNVAQKCFDNSILAD